jgi:hypothetical protein
MLRQEHDVLLFKPFIEWWYSGEDDAKTVYRAGWGFVKIGTVLAVLLYCIFPQVRDPRISWVLIVGILRGVAERRRAIIFSIDAVKYRPPFGRVRETRLDNILSFSEVSILQTIGWKPFSVHGIKLALKDGSTFLLPLDFSPSDEIRERIRSRIKADL